MSMFKKLMKVWDFVGANRIRATVLFRSIAAMMVKKKLLLVVCIVMISV